MGARRAAGFTLMELMVVIAIIAIIAAIAIPNLLDARKSGNESSAIGTLRAVNNAQGLFQDRDDDGDGAEDYAENLALLHCFGAGCIYGDLASEFCAANLASCDTLCRVNGVTGFCTVLCNDGFTQYCPLADPSSLCRDPGERLDESPGYTLQVQGTEPPPVAAYRALAIPLDPATGSRVFSIEENGQILAAVGHIPGPGDEVVDPGSGMAPACGAGCDQPVSTHIPTEAEIAAFEDAVATLSLDLLRQLDELSGGAGFAGAIEALEGGDLTTAFLDVLDPTGTGIGFAAVTETDLLATALDLAAPEDPPGDPIGDDPALSTILASYQSDLEQLLRLELDAPQPTVLAAALSGDPVALLQLFLPSVPMLGAAGLYVMAGALLVAGARSIRTRSAASTGQCRRFSSRRRPAAAPDPVDLDLDEPQDAGGKQQREEREPRGVRTLGSKTRNAAHALSTDEFEGSAQR